MSDDRINDFWDGWDWSHFPFPVDPFSESDLGIAPNIPMSEIPDTVFNDRFLKLPDPDVVDGELVDE